MHLNEAEIENIEENQPKYFDALSSLNESIVEVKKQFDEVQKQIETTHANHSDGIPLLRIKVCMGVKSQRIQFDFMIPSSAHFECILGKFR